MIRFEHIYQQYKQHIVLSDISFTINPGELVVLVGPSGCGKTTTLKMINTLIKPTKGTVYINEENIAEKDPIELRRNIGYVIQQTGLFPHLTARENIEIIPRLERRNKEEIVQRTIELMEMIGMDGEDYLDRYPVQLSGGQQQRIGVARAFSCDPDIILMDEPFSALDPITRNQLQDELIELQAKLHKTIVFVTHDMDEAVKIADRICIMNNGKIAQYDTPENILKHPADEFVDGFVGRNKIWTIPELIRAEDIMIENVIRTTPNLSVEKSIERMRRNRVDSIVVTDEKYTILGMATAAHLWSAGNLAQPIEAVMQSAGVIFHPQDSILDILHHIVKHNIPYVLIADEQHRLKGMISRSNLVTVLSQPFVLESEINETQREEN